MAASYPKWLKRDSKGAFIVNTDITYPIALKAIDAPKKPDRFHLEVAYQCTKMTVQELLEGRPEDPRVKGNPLLLLFEAKDKNKWAQSRHPEGKKTAAHATQGREARNYKAQVRAALLA